MGRGRRPQAAEAGQDCLATRVSAEQADHLAAAFPQAEQDRVARTFWLPAGPASRATPAGQVFVLTAGTSDLPVAQEAVVTARALGCEVELIADVGVAGIHRLLRHRDAASPAPTRSSSWPAWTGRCRAWSAGWSIAR